MDFAGGVHLLRTGEREAEVAALVSRFGERAGGGVGGRVGVAGVLTDLNRAATPRRVPGRAPVWGFGWDAEDSRSRRWFPQGITTSADQDDREEVGGRQVVCTSWYSKDTRGQNSGQNKGARLTFVDITDRSSPRYRHVLLVEPVLTSSGVQVRPVQVHAGGIVWYGPYLHVAATARGLYSFLLDDIVRVPTTGNPFGYRYLLPVRFTYDAFADDGFERLRYSFLSLDRSVVPHQLIAGEYGRRSMTTRLARYELDPATSLPRTHPDGRARPLDLSSDGVPGMQGATVVEGTYYVTTSSGRHGRGSLYVGRPGAFTRHANVLPVGPEDITYWPSRDQLWSLTEYPSRRYVYAMNRSEFG